MRVSVRLLGFTLLGCATVLPAQDAPAPASDLVVIGRKLRMMRVYYSMHGRWVHSCRVARRSGDPRTDRLMCAMLRSCVAQGYREVAEAKWCISRRVDLLDAEGARLAEMARLAGPVSAPSPSPITSPQARPTPTPGEIVVVGDREPPDIVVSGSRPTMRGGLWRFARSGTINYAGGGMSRPFDFTMCLPDGAIEDMLRRAAGEKTPISWGPKCGRLRMTLAEGRITGRRSCMTSGGISRNGEFQDTGRAGLDISGRLDAKRMTLNFGMEVAGSGPARVAAGAAWNPARPEGYRWRVLANRTGECPLERGLDQRTMDEALVRLFVPNATD